MKFRAVNSVAIAACEEAAKFMAGIAEGKVFSVAISEKDPGSIAMLRTWHGWMGETAVFMQLHGCRMPHYVDSKGVPHGTRPFNADDSHELFTHQYLGSDENGIRKSWVMSKSGDTIQASIGDRLWAMDQHMAYCAERGIKLTIPRKSEYWKLKQEQGEARA